MAKKIATIDCETDPFKAGRIPKPFIWGFYSLEHGQLFFNDAPALVEFLRGLDDYRVYAHNGGKFDFHYLLFAIENWQKITMVNGRIAQFYIDDCELVDSYCILPVGLGAYQKTKIDYAIFEKELRDIPHNKTTIANYLADDCKFLHELITEFIAENGYSLTIASAAIKKLQKIEKIKIEDLGRNFYEKLLPFYYGGRVECFEKGIVQGDIKYYDINSAYPFAMKHPHPWGDCIKTHEKNPRIQPHNFYSFTARSCGAFPFRDDDGALCFPNDGEKRLFNCTGWELIAAKDLGLLKDVTHHFQLVFLEQKDFSKYVDYYYTIKATSAKGSPENIFSKLFLNSAYGKFAANPEKYKTHYFCDSEEIGMALEEGFSIHGELHGRLIISQSNDPETWRHYNIATGASITGFVRAYLLRALHSVGAPLYCDTDSIVFTGTSTLDLSNDLGAWKLEGEFTRGGIGGKKIYAFENENTGDKKHACKGLRLEYDEVMEVCKGAKIQRTPDAPIYSIKKGIYFLQKTIAMT